MTVRSDFSQEQSFSGSPSTATKVLTYNVAKKENAQIKFQFNQAVVFICVATRYIVTLKIIVLLFYL